MTVYRVHILQTDPDIPERETSSPPAQHHPSAFLTRRHKAVSPLPNEQMAFVNADRHVILVKISEA